MTGVVIELLYVINTKVKYIRQDLDDAVDNSLSTSQDNKKAMNLSEKISPKKSIV